MRRSLRWLSLLVAFNLVVPATAVAQPKKPRTVAEELPADARREWNAGLTLFGDGNFKAAIVQFQRVYDMTKNPRVLPNLALAYKNAKNYAKALQTFERAIAEGGSVFAPKDLQDLKDSAAALRPYVSTLEITSNEAGATVTIDGEEIGTTPLPKPVDVSVGSHQVTVAKKDFRDQTRTVDVLPSKPASARFDLEATVVTALVSVTVEGAPKANLRIDGIDMGPAPYQGRIAVGKPHTFEASAGGFTTAKQTITPDKAEPFNVVLTMSQARNEGRVAIIARPAGALIEVDQKLVGMDKWEGPVAATGGHRVRIHKDGYIDEVQEISVAPDQTRTIDVELRQNVARGALVWTIGSLLVVGGSVIAGVVLANKGRDDAPVSGTFAPPTQATWYHR